MAKQTNHLDAAKSVIALLIICLMARVFFLFYQNSDELLQSNQFPEFMTLAVVGGGLLIGLLYLVNKSTDKPKTIAHKSSARKSHKKK